jgi:hypothetical protein
VLFGDCKYREVCVGLQDRQAIFKSRYFRLFCCQFKSEIMSPQKILKILAVLFLFAESASAQIGFKTSLVSPDGDIGQFYNKGVSGDLYFVAKDDNGPWRERAGIFYTKLSARLDTFPIYAVQTGPTVPGGTLVLPGYQVDHEFNMLYIYMDIGYRVLRVKKFSLYVGAGLEGGKSNVQYDRGYETVLQETGNTDLLIAGYKLTSNLEYRVNSHFEVLAEAVANRMTTTDWSTKYEHNTFGIGIDYYIKPRMEQTKPKHRHKHKHKHKHKHRE